MKPLSKLPALGVLAALFLVSAPAHAGAYYPGFLSCSRSGDGSGSCSGTYSGARTSSYGSDQVSFSLDNYGYGYFWGVYLGVSYGCSVSLTAGTLMSAVWAAAMTSRNYFYVAWDSGGNCSWVYIINSSGYASIQ